MEKLDEIDQQLAALGAPAADLSGAIDRALGKDRSPARLDELLSGLGEVPAGMLRPRTPSLMPPRRSPLPPRIVSPSLPLATPIALASPLLPSLTAAAPAQPTAPAPTTPLPQAFSPTAVAAPQAWPPLPSHPAPASPVPPAPASPAPEPTLAAQPRLPRITDTLVDTPYVPLPPIRPSEDDLDAETAALLGDSDARPSMPSAVPLPFGPSTEISAEALAEDDTRVGPPPDEIEAAAEAKARRDSVRALLDQEIDPNDFPSERPPKPSAGDGDDVEMLLEDDEILEIEDDELLEDDES